MSVNTAHTNNGVLIHAGEWILLFSDNVSMEFVGQDDVLFKGSKVGKIFLTTHRVIFNNKQKSDPLQSFSFPFVAMSDIDIEQPIMGANYIKGKIRAQPNGNWTGEAKFKVYFKSGGAIDFGQAMKRAAVMAQRYMRTDAPPPYTPPTGSWYEAPPPAYQAPPGYYGWIPNGGSGISQNPPPNTVYMSDNPPPYPGISGQPQPGPTPNGNPGYPGGAPTGGYPGSAPPQFGYPGANQPGNPGPPQTGYPAPQPGYLGPNQPGYPAPAQPGYPGGQGGYPGYPGPGQPTGYPAPGEPTGYHGNPGFGQPAGYPASAPPNMGYPGYPGGAPGPSAGQMGFTSGPPQNSKEAEAAQSSYYDPNRPQTAYVPPPAYYEPPPSYDSVSKKNQ